jgi:hypothetical protein
MRVRRKGVREGGGNVFREIPVVLHRKCMVAAVLPAFRLACRCHQWASASLTLTHGKRTWGRSGSSLDKNNIWA